MQFLCFVVENCVFVDRFIYHTTENSEKTCVIAKKAVPLQPISCSA